MSSSPWRSCRPCGLLLRGPARPGEQLSCRTPGGGCKLWHRHVVNGGRIAGYALAGSTQGANLSVRELRRGWLAQRLSAGMEPGKDVCPVSVTAPLAPAGDYHVTRLQTDLNLPNTGSPSLRGTINNPDFPADGNAVSKPIAPGRKRSQGAETWRMERVPWGKRSRDRISFYFPYCVSVGAFGISVVWWEVPPSQVAFSGQGTFSLSR